MMNKKCALLAVLVFLLPGCWEAAKEEDSIVYLRIINVLDKKYFDDAHIKPSKGVESINVPVADLKKVSANWDKSIPVVTYCANPQCLASHSAAEELTKDGFNASVYTGGTAEWYQLAQKDTAFQVEGPAKEEYLTLQVKKLSKPAQNVKEIDAQELQKMIKEATLHEE